MTPEDRICISAKSKQAELTQSELHDGCRLGLDSHADVSCAGRHARILEIVEGRACTVYPFNDSYNPIQNVQTVNAAMAIDLPDGETYILRLNHALDFTQSMNHSILCTNQSRMHGIKINDVPQLCEHNSQQNIIIPTAHSTLPIQFHGPVPYIHVRHPTDAECAECDSFDITSPDDWDPYLFSSDANNISSNIVSGINHSFTYLDHSLDLGEELSKHVHIKGIGINSVTKVPAGDLTPEYLSKLWHIPIKIARKTLNSTTHETIRILASGDVQR